MRVLEAFYEDSTPGVGLFIWSDLMFYCCISISHNATDYGSVGGEVVSELNICTDLKHKVHGSLGIIL